MGGESKSRPSLRPDATGRTAQGAYAPTKLLGYHRIVAPFLHTGLGVDRMNDSEGGGKKHRVIDHDRRRPRSRSTPTRVTSLFACPIHSTSTSNHPYRPSPPEIFKTSHTQMRPPPTTPSPPMSAQHHIPRVVMQRSTRAWAPPLHSHTSHTPPPPTPPPPPLAQARNRRAQAAIASIAGVGCVYVCVFMCMCVYVCVCVSE